MSQNMPQPQIQHFLQHQTFWGVTLLLGWFSINICILATNVIIELQRISKTIPLWEPFCWEISSVAMILLLMPLAIYLSDLWLSKLSIKPKLALHALLSIPFSVAHVGGMYAIRQLWYRLMDSDYQVGSLPLELLYEYRKDAQTYLTLALIVFGYRLIVRRLQGEASYIANGDELESRAPEQQPEHLLIKKLGREFLIQTRDIEWVEAAGNYANIHIKNSIYPMRITMDKLEQMLPSNFTRIHRSTIVNLEHIKEIAPLDTGDHQITLDNQKTLTLSRRYREEFKSLLRFT